MGLALAGYTLWVLADTSLKIAGASALPAYEVIALLGFAIAALLLLRRTPRELWPKQPGRQLLRSLLDLANNVGVVIALRHLPLALFYILVFLSPMMTSLLAAIFLGESLNWKQGLAIVAGFFGVVIAVNPLNASRAGDWQGYVACAVCVACFSTNMVWSRRMTQTETPESLTFFSGLVMGVAGSAAMLWHAQPVGLRIGAVLVGTAVFCVLGNMCFFTALKHASAAQVSQFHYSQLLTGSVIAYALWHERLTRPMLGGAALIVGAGVYTAARTLRGGKAAVFSLNGDLPVGE